MKIRICKPIDDHFMARWRNSSGFSLVELVVVMGIFIVVIIISTYAFDNINRTAARESKTAKTQIEGVIGLEMMRSDIQQAGLGLPWAFRNISGVTYSEAADVANYPVQNINRKGGNDPVGTPPRALISANDVGLNGSDYLVVKSTVVGTSAVAKKWTYVSYAATGGVINRWNNPSDDFVAGDKAIVIRSTFNVGSGTESRELVGDHHSHYYVTLTGNPPTTLPSDFSPQSITDTYLLYGVSTDNLGMPFNRAEYYLSRPSGGSFPKTCNPNTGILYKGTCNHDGGGLTPLPLVDCVADMQVIYLLDMNDDGEGGTYSNANGTSSTGSESFSGSVADTLGNGQLLRQRLKEVRVYILAQEGGKDRGFSYPNQNVTVGEFGLGHTFDLSTLGSDWRNYRWKIYTIVVEPRNIRR